MMQTRLVDSRAVGLWVVPLLWLLTASVAHAFATGATGRSVSPYFHIDDGDPSIDHFPLKQTSVDFRVIGVIADVAVAQVYENAGTRPISARYVFPASVRAAVHGMRMTIGARTIEAQIQERARAQATYEAAARAGKTASLLEQERPNVFSMRVANVMPGERVEVELRYTELLIPTEGEYEFVYPTVVGPRYGADGTESAAAPVMATAHTPEGEQARYGFALHGHMATGVPLQELSVPSHRTSTNRLGPDRVELALDESESSGGDRDFILHYRLAGEQVDAGLLLYRGQDDGAENYFLLTVQPPVRPAPAALPAREYVFVLDVSGSMHGFPLDVAKGVIREVVGGLRPQDTFNIMLFSGGSSVLWPRSRPASSANLETALALIDEQDGGGGTELRAALERALAMPSGGGTARSFVVVTDGYISAERETFELVRKNLGQANVFAFGIGTSVNRYLVEGLSKAGLGEAFVITDASESVQVAGRFRAYIESPVLTDIALNADGFDMYDVEPPAIPDLLAERPLVIQGKWRGAPGGRLSVRGKSGAGAFERTVEVAGASPSPEYEALARLWARTRIAAVSDFSFGQVSELEKELVTDLGLRFGLLTDYTSFVAVSHVARNSTGGSDEVDQPLPLPVGVSDAAVGDPMYGAPEPELWILFLVGLVLGLRLLSRSRARTVLS